MVAAAYAESGLDAGIKNRAGSGAAGLFQLLSSGYVQRANAHGGVFNPQANIDAILPDYVSYWRSHPNASPGEAAAAVERSGMGPSFYAAPLRVIGGVTAGQPMAQTHAQPSQAMQPVGQPDYHLAQQQLAQSLIEASQQTQRGEHSNIPKLLGAVQNYHSMIDQAREQAQQQAAAVQSQQAGSPPVAAPGDASLTSANPGATPSPGAGKLDSRLVALSHRYGLKITSGFRTVDQNTAVGGAPDSYHMKGEAIDVQPTGNALQFYKYALKHPQLFTELFYDPAGLYIKNGQIIKGAIGGHSDHVHIVLAQ